MSMNTPDLMLLLRMIRYRGWIDERVLDSVLSDCGPSVSSEGLLERLVMNGNIDLKQAEMGRRFLKEKTRALKVSSGERFRIDRSFGQIALERGLIEVAQLEEALLEQERLRRLRLNFRIGEVLVRLQALSVDQVRSILREQGFDLSCCRECDALIEGASEDGKSGTCPFCDGELRPPVFLDPVPADHPRSR